MTSVAIADRTINVPFHGANLYVVNHNGEAYTPMKPIVEGMGMDWASQFTKLKNRFSKGVVEITIPSTGGLQSMICLALRKLAAWLNTISPNKVRPEIRERVIRYQEECDDVLYDYWTKGMAVRQPESTVDDRTPLRGIVNRIMGKYGMTFQAVYKLIHKEFGVKHIEELSPKQTSEAIEYLAGKIIEGEFIAKNEKPIAVVKSKEAPRYRVQVIIYDDLMNGCAEMLGRGNTMQDIAWGISCDLGYRPDGFTRVPMNRERLKRIS